MPRGTLLAGCLLLGWCGCTHKDAADSSGGSLYGPEDSAIASTEGPLPVDSDAEAAPDVPIHEAWKQGAKSITVHRSASCPEDSIEDSGCGNETTYYFQRSKRELTLSSCSCGSEHSKQKKLTLSPVQSQELDRLITGLEMVAGPQVTCTAESSDTLWELIVANAESVEQSYPIALCQSPVRQAGKISSRSFQALYEYLKKTLAE